MIFSRYTVCLLSLLAACSKQNDQFKNNHLDTKTPVYNLNEDATKSVEDNIKTEKSKNITQSPHEYGSLIAVVNGEIITKQDLDSRVNLTLMGASEISKAEKDSISREVLKEMVYEVIKLGYAKKFAAKGWVHDVEIISAFDNIAKRNNLSPKEFEELLKKNNIDKSVLLKHIEANLTWVEYIKARYGRNITVSSVELKRLADDMQKQKDTNSYYVSRIFLHTDDTNSSSVNSTAQKLKYMLNNGSSFHELARQFSKAPEANNGGDLGWVFHGRISDVEYQALTKMNIGDVSIVKTSDGFSILQLKDKRDASKKTFTEVRFVQIVFPYKTAPTDAIVNQVASEAYSIKMKSKSAKEFIDRAKYRNAVVSPENAVDQDTMQNQLKDIISKIPTNTVSDPIITPQGVLMVCILDRKDQPIKHPTLDDAKAQKLNEKLSSMSEKEMTDLKKRAEVKLNPLYGTFTELLQ